MKTFMDNFHTRPATIASAFFAMAFVIGCTSKVSLKGIQLGTAKVETTVSTTSSGTVDAQNQAVLSFGTPGNVAHLYVALGAEVKRDQLLAEIENGDAKITMESTLQELKRTEQLFKEHLSSKAGLDESRRAYEVARLQYDRTILKAPFDGLITELNLRVGESSQGTVQQLTTAGGGSATSKSPLRIVDLKPRIIKGDIDELDLSKVHVGQNARVKIPSVRREFFEATVTRVIPFISTTKEQDRTAQVELTLKETDQKIPVGASADIEIIVSSKDNVLAVPSKLVLGGSAGRHVFVERDGKLQKVAIKTGEGNYERTEILDGIKQGEVVVYPSDTIELKDGIRAEVEIQKWP